MIPFLQMSYRFDSFLVYFSCTVICQYLICSSVQDSIRDSPGGDEILQSKNKVDSSLEVPVLASHDTTTKPDSDQTDYT